MLDSIELDVVRELEAGRGAEKLGWASARDFVTAVAGGHKGAGPAMVRLAQALEQPVLAPVAQAQRDGWLSTAKAHVIARAIDLLPPSRDGRERGVQVLLEEAKRLDATDLRKVARRLVEVVDPDGTERREEKERDREERNAHLGRHLSIRDDGAGGAFIRGRCSSEDAAQIRSTLMPLSRPVPTSVPDCDPKTCALPGCGHDGRDPRDHGARMLDALVEAMRRLQGTEPASRQPRRRPAHQHRHRPRRPARADRCRCRCRCRSPTPARSSHPKPYDAWPATPTSSRSCSAPARRSSTSAGTNGSPPWRSGGPSSSATGTAGSPAARAHRSCATPTTSSTGSTAVPRVSTTCCCSAATTTDSCTPGPGPSPNPPRVTSASTHPTPCDAAADHAPAGSSTAPARDQNHAPDG